MAYISYSIFISQEYTEHLIKLRELSAVRYKPFLYEPITLSKRNIRYIKERLYTRCYYLPWFSFYCCDFGQNRFIWLTLTGDNAVQGTQSRNV